MIDELPPIKSKEKYYFIGTNGDIHLGYCEDGEIGQKISKEVMKDLIFRFCKDVHKIEKDHLTFNQHIEYIDKWVDDHFETGD
jgi:hypothetical protein